MVAAGAAASHDLRLQPAWIAIGLAALGGLALLTIAGRWLARALHSQRERQRASSAFAQRQLLQAARTGDPQTAYRALTVWRERLSPADLSAMDRDPALAAASIRLGRALFADTGDWDRTAATALARAVAGWQQVRAADAAAEPLPPLNPTA